MVPRHRIGYIDGLRAVAVLSVAAFHAFHSTKSASIGAPIGVGLFFVLSGFCLSYPTLFRLRESGVAGFNVASYAARRLVRIVPPYYIAIAVLVAFAWTIARLGFALPESMARGGITLPDVVHALFFLDAHSRYIDWSFWTLPVEFRWYFIFPVALWLWTVSPRAFALALFALMFVVPLTLAASLDLFVLPAFLLGIVAAHLRLYERRWERWALPCAVVLVPLAYLQSPGFITPVWALAMFAVVVAAGAFKPIEAVLSFRGLTTVGFASYSIYLIHQPVILFCEAHGTSPWLALAVSLLAGFAFWAAAERPFVETSVRVTLLKELSSVFNRWAVWLRVDPILGFQKSTTEKAEAA
jgi:peptidoglycan/LPS O-acetylase OafA/YrhL